MTVTELEDLLLTVAELVVEDSVYTPIYLRIEREIEIAQNDPAARARALIASRRAAQARA